MKLTKHQRIYCNLQSAIDELGQTHFDGCDDISDVLGDDADEREVLAARKEGHALLKQMEKDLA